MRIYKLFLSILLAGTFLDAAVALGARCPRLSLKNGRVKIRAKGKMAQFKCKKRYTRVGEKFAVCIAGGHWSHPTPKCINRGCPRIGALPGIEVTETYNGAMLKFHCPMGTKRTGPATITCDGKKWSHTPPTCDRGLTMGCDFEDEGLCGWSQEEFDHFDWTRKSGTTPTIGTGPQGDHTTGTGYYMFIESSSPRKPGHVARLLSPIYPPSLRNMCFDFWYHMKGPDEKDAMGSLEVFVKPDTASLSDLDPEFYDDVNHGDDWQRGVFRIRDQDENFQIVIVGTRKNGFISDIAIDDLRLFNCTEETTTVMTTMTSTTTPLPVTTWSANDNMTVTNSEYSTTHENSTDQGTQATNASTSIAGTTSTSTAPSSSATPYITTTTVQSTSSSTMMSTTTKMGTSSASTPSTSTSATSSRGRLTSRKRPKTTTTMPASTETSPRVKTTTPPVTMAITSVYNFNVTDDESTSSSSFEVTSPEVPTSAETSSVVDVSTATQENTTSLNDSALYSPTMNNEINTQPTSTKNDSSVTTELSNVVLNANQLPGKSGKSIGKTLDRFLPMIIGVSAGIVGGMIVIGLLAWLWGRSQRKKKEREAAEDEMYMLNT